jgi:hypothetical protein
MSAMKTVLGFALICFKLTLLAEDERFLIDAKIDNKPVRMILDTRSCLDFVLFSTAAQELGLKVTPPSPTNHLGPGEVAYGKSEVCDLDIMNSKLSTPFSVIDKPAY